MSDIVKIIGERIRMHRTRKNLSQDALGDIAGLHGKYIGQLERGEKNATIVSIEKVARALELPLEILFENIVLGETYNDNLYECYNLIVEMTDKEQRAMLDLIKKAMDYKKA